MADASIGFEVKQWNGLIKKTQLFFKTSYPKLRAAVAIFGFKDVIKHFEQEAGPQGGWAARKKRTNVRYEKIRKGKSKTLRKGMYRASNKTLQLSGDLRRSFLQGNKNQEKLGEFATLMFTNVPYAGTHNKGDSSRNIVKREFMWLSNQAQVNILNTLMDDLEKGIK